MDFFRDSQIDFMKYRKFWIVISFALLVVGIFSVFVHGKLNIGIDFAGGTQLTVKFAQPPEIDRLRSLLAEAGLGEAQLQRFGEADSNEVMIKTPLLLAEATGTEAAGATEVPEEAEDRSREMVVTALQRAYGGAEPGKIDLNQAGRNAFTDALLRRDPERLVGDPGNTIQVDEARAHYAGIADSILDLRRDRGIFGSVDELAAAPGVTSATVDALREGAYLSSFAIVGVENVGPLIGQELKRQGILAVVLALIGMLVYIWIRFEIQFGVGALMASLHDVLVCLGLYALLGYEFNLTTIAAFLTLVGYSVNDTVVVFDRVRENLRKNRREPLLEVMNRSLNQTLARTVLTSGTTLLASVSLFLFGGDVLRGFSFVLTVGVIVGTYSSIYIAGPFTLLWEHLFGKEAVAKRRAMKAA